LVEHEGDEQVDLVAADAPVVADLDLLLLHPGGLDPAEGLGVPPQAHPDGVLEAGFRRRADLGYPGDRSGHDGPPRVGGDCRRAYPAAPDEITLRDRRFRARATGRPPKSALLGRKAHGESITLANRTYAAALLAYCRWRLRAEPVRLVLRPGDGTYSGRVRRWARNAA